MKKILILGLLLGFATLSPMQRGFSIPVSGNEVHLPPQVQQTYDSWIQHNLVPLNLTLVDMSVVKVQNIYRFFVRFSGGGPYPLMFEIRANGQWERELVLN